MAVPGGQIILVDSEGRRLDIDAVVDQVRREPGRVLVDDDVGLVLYVGGLGLYNLSATDTGEFLAQPVTELSRPRFSTRVIRRQIGATAFSMTTDAVFVVRDGGTLKKIRAEKLEPGMVLASGEKVYR